MGVELHARSGIVCIGDMPSHLLVLHELLVGVVVIFTSLPSFPSCFAVGQLGMILRKVPINVFLMLPSGVPNRSVRGVLESSGVVLCVRPALVGSLVLHQLPVVGMVVTINRISILSSSMGVVVQALVWSAV